MSDLNDVTGRRTEGR